MVKEKNKKEIDKKKRKRRNKRKRNKTQKRKKKKIKKPKKIRWIRLAFVLIIAALIFSSLTMILYNYFKYSYNQQVQIYDMKLQVGDHIRFNIENNSLNFGMVMPEGTSERSIEISSDVPVYVMIFFEGDFIDWIDVSKNDFEFKGKDSILFTVKIPENATFNNYTGKAVILFKRL